MPYTRNKGVDGTDTARVGNNDVEGRFYFSDANASPPNELRVAVTLTADNTDGTVFRYIVDAPITDVSTMTTTERNQLKSRLAQVRDWARDQKFTLT